MSNKKIFGLGLSGISLLLALGTGLYFLVSGGFVSITQFIWPAMGFMVGMAIIFFGFVDGGLQIDDEIADFPHLIEDDIDDLRSGIITPTHLFIVVTAVAALIELGILLWLRKIEAAWGPINVMFVALVVVGITLFFALRSPWFQNRDHRLKPLFFVVPAVGWLICLFIGISYAEPIEWGGPTGMERSQAVSAANNRQGPRPGMTYFLMDTTGDALTSMDCDGDECLFGLLILIVVISVAASAAIPHFWVVATMLLLTLMAMIALRELLFRDDAY